MKKIVILDLSAIIYRSHFAMSKLINRKGVHTGATFGLVRQIEACIKEIEPQYIVAALDIKRKNLKRVEKFSSYKADRKPMPEELSKQLEYIYKILDAYNIKRISVDGYEADDVIASLAKLSVENDIKPHIYTGDKDLQQIIKEDDKINIHILGKDIVIKNKEDVLSYIGVYPESIPDLFGLMGDKSDGIPGVSGIGIANGVKLLSKYGSIEGIYENIDEIKGKNKVNLENDKENAFLSKKLAIVNENLELGYSISDLEYEDKNIDELIDIYKDLELNSLLNDLSSGKKKKELELKIISKDEMIKVINNSKNVTIYTDEYFLNAVTEDLVVYNTQIFDLKLLSSKPHYNLFDAKKYMHLGLKLDDNFFDNLIAAYIIETHSKLDVEDVIMHYLDVKIPVFTKRELKKISVSDLRKKSVDICYGIYELEKILSKKLKKLDTEDTYSKIEKPLITTLYNMEKRGIKISIKRFRELRYELEKVIKENTEKIFEITNEEFNIDSPKQLGEILFEKLGIKHIKKTKIGYSTDASVLEELSLRGIEIADYLLVYRENKKLLSTYVDAIPKFADSDKRVHSVFSGTGTVTGRLSSYNPNLQNIPARNENGNKIRSCFVAKEGYKLISFDYSQIELRVLAELSEDKVLIEAYNNDLDLHELTARELFNKHNPSEIITKEERNLAKIINFSVLYGKTAYGLSKELKIPVADAKTYINKYFEKYKVVGKFIEKIVDDAIANSYVETLFGTKRYINGIKSTNSFVFEQAKRMAVNTVIQGTAANIIKLVMNKLQDMGYDMLIQVHDELIFEVENDKVDEALKNIKELMENTVKFKNVKLKVNYAVGDDWGELK